MPSLQHLRTVSAMVAVIIEIFSLCAFLKYVPSFIVANSIHDVF